LGKVISGETQRGRFEGNIYWSVDERGLSFDGYDTLREWSEATGQEKIGEEIAGRYIDPQLVKPGTATVIDPAALADMVIYRLNRESPCIGAGILLKHNGGRDFWGNRVPESQRPAIGACEKPQLSPQRQ